jgi:hypothetical protein
MWIEYISFWSVLMMLAYLVKTYLKHKKELLPDASKETCLEMNAVTLMFMSRH